MTPDPSTPSAVLPPPVALIGPMAAGKSSVGRRLAKILSRDFVDTDRRVTAEHGPIPAIFEEQGEAVFRQLEHEQVAKSLLPGHIVALGGGAVLNEATRALLAEATVVLVTVTESAVAARIDNDRRPLIAEGGVSAWRRIAADREPIYRQLAHVEADTSRRPIAHIAEEVAAWVLEHEHRVAHGEPTADRSSRID